VPLLSVEDFDCCPSPTINRPRPTFIPTNDRRQSINYSPIFDHHPAMDKCRPTIVNFPTISQQSSDRSQSSNRSQPQDRSPSNDQSRSKNKLPFNNDRWTSDNFQCSRSPAIDCNSAIDHRRSIDRRPTPPSHEFPTFSQSSNRSQFSG
jgi:hypothetical protein